MFCGCGPRHGCPTLPYLTPAGRRGRGGGKLPGGEQPRARRGAALQQQQPAAQRRVEPQVLGRGGARGLAGCPACSLAVQYLLQPPPCRSDLSAALLASSWCSLNSRTWLGSRQLVRMSAWLHALSAPIAAHRLKA